MLLIHGDNQVKSRQRLISLIKAFGGEVVRLRAEKSDLTQFRQALESASLFATNRLVVLEGWPEKAIFNYVKNFANVVIWVGKKVDGRKILGLKPAEIEFYKISPAIFAFLDNLNLNTFRLALNQNPVEMIFFLLAKRLRLLLIAQDEGYAGLSEVSPFEKNKILAQAKKYSSEQLLDFYDKLLGLEYGVKSGRNNSPLALQLEVLLASL